MANRKVYLVDTENVGTTWKEILPQKNTKDLIILFYTENSPGISELFPYREDLFLQSHNPPH